MHKRFVMVGILFFCGIFWGSHSIVVSAGQTDDYADLPAPLAEKMRRLKQRTLEEKAKNEEYDKAHPGWREDAKKRQAEFEKEFPELAREAKEAERGMMEAPSPLEEEINAWTASKTKELDRREAELQAEQAHRDQEATQTELHRIGDKLQRIEEQHRN